MKKYAIILAAGIGSRLYPLTESYPKSLIKVNGKEILSYQIEGYLNAGISEEKIYIVTGYKHEMISEFLEKNYPNIKEIYSKDYLSTNNMYSLYLALKQIKDNCPEFIMINNADCIYDVNLIKNMADSNLNNAIATDKNLFLEESMKVVERNGVLIDISKTIKQNDTYGVSIDLYKFSQSAINKLYQIIKNYIEIKKELKLWTEVAFPELFKEEKIFPFDINGKKWIEIDNNEDLTTADKMFSSFNIQNKKAMICDLDGTLFIGNTPIKKAVYFIKNYNTAEIFYLTNNTSKNPKDYVKKIENTGIKTDIEHILTPLYPLIDYIKTNHFKSIFLIANSKVREYLENYLPNVQFDFDENTNEAVILTYDTEINYEKLKNACILINKGIKYIATHTDVFCPSEKGSIPDIGSFIKLIEATTDKLPEKIFGKPEKDILLKPIKQYSVKDLFIAGDRLYTDNLLAQTIGCDFVCVLSGETKREDIQHLQDNFPSLVIPDLGEIEL